jgi:hypothetical protein
MIDWRKHSLLRTKTGEWIHYVSSKGRDPFNHIGYIGDNNKLHAWDKNGKSVYGVENYSIIEPLFGVTDV